MDQVPSSKMMMFHIPDADILEIVGAIALRHSQLDYVLRMTVKTLTGVSIKQALDATAFEGSSLLRRRVGKLAKKKLGEGNTLIQLQALLERCRRATDDRNELMHNLWAQELDGDPKVRSADHQWKPVPDVENLRKLENELETLTKELNTARLDGFLSQALVE